MKSDELVRMANQIAANFHLYAEDEAVAAISSHLRRFWEPRMRSALLTAAAEGRAPGLTPRVQAALRAL
ncbi:MAG: formate dehydrogenase subunit delta [Alphaproteobacteria bacterium]|nr:formate dehydrogenase subunit delta [Alphaproteobacteria bacterium]